LSRDSPSIAPEFSVTGASPALACAFWVVITWKPYG
jgi:hypothetical protein